MACSVPSWSLHCNPADQGICKSKLLLDVHLHWSAAQPGNQNYHCIVTNPPLCYSELQRLAEFELCFQMGFEGRGTGVITQSVHLSIGFPPSTSLWLDIKFLHILRALVAE